MAKKQREWTESDLAIQFGLERIFDDFPILSDWMNSTTTLSKIEENNLDEILNFAKRKIDFWYEEDFKMNFISPILNNFIKFHGDNYDTFYDREISAEVDGIMLLCKPDFMIAKGIYDRAQQPYFHFHAGGVPQYKRSKKNPADPVGQILEAMLIAQKLNTKTSALYGLYCIGRSFVFIVLEGKKYAISDIYEAIKKEDLIQIIAILRKFKVILETELLND